MQQSQQQKKVYIGLTISELEIVTQSIAAQPANKVFDLLVSLKQQIQTSINEKGEIVKQPFLSSEDLQQLAIECMDESKDEIGKSILRGFIEMVRKRF